MFKNQGTKEKLIFSPLSQSQKLYFFKSINYIYVYYILKIGEGTPTQKKDRQEHS